MTANIYCRLCATKCDMYINIYDDEGKKLNLATKITQCLQIWLYPEDTLPKTVCTNCCSKLDQYFDFFELCSQSQVSLKQMMNSEKNVKEEATELGGEDGCGNEYEDDDGDNEDDNNDEDEDEIDDYDNDEDFKIYNDSNLSLEFTTAERRSSRRKLRTPVKRTSHSDEQGTPEEKPSSDKPIIKIKPVKRATGKRGRKQKVSTKSKAKNENGESKPHTTRGSLEGYIWKCTDCPEELTTLSALKTHHIEVHNQPPNFKCSQCTKVYTRYRSFARHVKLHGNPKKFSCDICGKCFSQKTVLQSHSTVHSEERPHVCPQCGKAFKQFSSLYLHSKCHLPDTVKPKFPCSACPKEFSTKHTLETHFKIHTGERNYVCDICGKSFIAKGSLDYHILTHNDTKPHSCPVCGKGFKTARLLTKHSTLHTGIKPHQCDVCGKQFRERGALKEHNRIHTGAMPYSCEFCGKMFRFKGILTVHRRQHTGERPYGCTDCRREFTNWANYNKHMKRRHRNSEHNSALASRILARQQLQTIIQPATQEVSQPPQPPPPPVPPAPPPPPLIPAPVLHHTSPGYTEHNSNSEPTYNKLGEEHNSDVYRGPAPPSYVPMAGMGYYIQPIHQHVLQARNQ